MKKGTPTITKNKLLSYLGYSSNSLPDTDGDVDILKLVKYLAMHSNGALKLTSWSRNKAEWNIEEDADGA